jgi:carboxymethylenebutenolidase
VTPILLPAVEELRNNAAVTGQRIGVIGFSMGAYWALWLAQKEPELFKAVVLFYGTNGGGGDFHNSQASFLGHFAEMDPYETADTIQALEKNLKGANRPTNFYTYPATGHWFFEKDRPDAYQAQAARQPGKSHYHRVGWELIPPRLSAGLCGFSPYEDVLFQITCNAR